MREIKFRAWCKLDEILYDWERVKKEFTLEYFDDRGLIFQQYTGLKDKNGVEIYEGDIVNHYWSNEVGESFCHKTVIKNPFDYKANEAMYFNYCDGLEVIGNIYENPELLKTKKSS